MEQEQTKKKWRWGVNRWIVLLLIISSVFAAKLYKPVLPHIQLPAEVVGHIGGFGVTNTMIAMIITDIFILLMAFLVRGATKTGSLIPTGFSGALEAFLEALYGLTESTAGKWTKQIFPWFASITLFVLIANWMELIPGTDSIGLIEHAHGEGHAIQNIAGFAATLLPEKGDYALTSFVRVLSTDLNFTVGLALISMFMVQVMGLKALGIGYLSKFFYVKTIFSKPIFGVIDFAVGILEIVSEFSKILSFSFRLFGNIFAGSVLLFVIGTLIPVFAQSIFLMLEFFIGLIQALIFGLLTMVFMSQAVHGHGDTEEEHKN
ncbi:MAG TPA: F0F1 ATP synthase subunit A [Anaerolineae bacterium]|nr:F0F1 ATP synthase subunit A [Anaerolineae bacterium]